MTPHDIHTVIQGFFTLLESERAPDERERALRRVLDQLAIAYHHAEGHYDERDHPEPQRPDSAALRTRVAACFPGLGFYSVALDSTDLEATEPSIGDALDDLTDILGDLQEVLDRWTVSEADALWYFRLLYEIHWGHHLRQLQLHLHERAF